MWMASQQGRELLAEPAAELGEVTLSGAAPGVALAGERRNVTVCAPGGYRWAPAQGDTVLVIKCGAEQTPCVAGTVQENDLAPGEICLSAAQGAEIRLTPEGEIRLTGRVTVNGQEV